MGQNGVNANGQNKHKNEKKRLAHYILSLCHFALHQLELTE